MDRCYCKIGYRPYLLTSLLFVKSVSPLAALKDTDHALFIIGKRTASINACQIRQGLGERSWRFGEDNSLAWKDR